MALTAEQIRGARAMLRMEQTQLAERAGISVETIKRLEGTAGRLVAQYDTLKKIRTAFEFAGIEFTDDADRPGVRLAKDRTAAFLSAMTEEITSLVRVTLEINLQRDPSLVEGPKKQLINVVLKSVEETLKHTLPRRLPGKN